MSGSTAWVVDPARSIAVRAHAGQVDAQGRDYVEHHLRPIAEALAVFGPYAAAAGWLHDVIEDTDVTAEDLRAAGVPAFVIEAVVAVSRVPGEPYPALIARAIAHPLGRLVKLADNTLNVVSNPALALTDPDRARSMLEGRYLPARASLLDGIDADPALLDEMNRRLAASG